MRERDAMKTKREEADALAKTRAAAAREASHIKKQRSRRAVAAFVRPRYEYAINEDARRAQLAADVAAAEPEKPGAGGTRSARRRTPRPSPRSRTRSCGV